jgi:hypothetical protein
MFWFQQTQINMSDEPFAWLDSPAQVAPARGQPVTIDIQSNSNHSLPSSVSRVAAQDVIDLAMQHLTAEDGNMPMFNGMSSGVDTSDSRMPFVTAGERDSVCAELEATRKAFFEMTQRWQNECRARAHSEQVPPLSSGSIVQSVTRLDGVRQCDECTTTTHQIEQHQHQPAHAVGE